MMHRVLGVLAVVAIGCTPVVSAQDKCVDPQKLQGILPAGDVPGGFVREAPSASLQSSPFGRVAKATVTYRTKTDVPRTITVSITDLAENLYAAAAIMNATGNPGAAVGDRDGEATIVMVAGKYRGKESSSETAAGSYVEFVVANRFDVRVESIRVPDLKTLHALIDTMPLATLEKLR